MPYRLIVRIMQPNSCRNKPWTHFGTVCKALPPRLQTPCPQKRLPTTPQPMLGDPCLFGAMLPQAPFKRHPQNQQMCTIMRGLEVGETAFQALCFKPTSPASALKRPFHPPMTRPSTPAECVKSTGGVFCGCWWGGIG
jgi:hypothetical protein